MLRAMLLAVSASGIGVGLLTFVALPLVLVAFHTVVWRRLAHPPPFIARKESTTARRTIAIGVGATLLCYLAAALPFVVSLRVEGVPGGTKVSSLSGSPAASAGVLDGDRVLSVDGARVDSFEEVRAAVARGDEALVLELERDGQQHTVAVRKDERGRIGISSVADPLPLGAALARGLIGPAQVVSAVAESFFRLGQRGDSAELSGPVGIVRAADGTEPQQIRWFAVALAYRLLPVLVIYWLAAFIDYRLRAAFR